MADGKPPSEQDTSEANQETIRISSGADKRIWGAMVMRRETRFCYCGKTIDGLFMHGRSHVMVKHEGSPSNPITCQFPGVITDEMREFYNDAKTDT